VWGLKNHPLWRLIVALTIKEIENAKPLPKKYKMADGGGLCLLVAPSGSKLWVWRYRFNGAEKNMHFGEYQLSKESAFNSAWSAICLCFWQSETAHSCRMISCYSS